MLKVQFASISVAIASVAAVLAQGCSKEGCLGGEDGCRVAPPCQKVAFTCGGDELQIRRLTGGDRPGGLDALGAKGDVLIGNGQVTAVIADIGNQNYVDPNGGTLLDLVVTGKDHDSLNQMLQSVGLIPRDGARYERLELIDERPNRVAVQAVGKLDGRPDIPIYTLYELRPCDRGVRIRTEIVNGSMNQELWTLADLFYWSDREPVSFTPGEDMGFKHPEFGLFTADDAYRRFPYMGMAAHEAPYSAYSLVACNEKFLEGFNNVFLSTAGRPRTFVPPRDFQVYERFLSVVDGRDVAAAANVALEIRAQLFGESLVTVSGKVESLGGKPLGTSREASVVISEGQTSTPPEKRISWTQVVPDATGAFFARVPAGKDYVVEVHAFGRKRIERDFAAVAADTDLGTFSLPSTSRVTLTVTDGASANRVTAQVFVIPENDTTREETGGDWHGHYGRCEPWLGPQHGGSPACNRVLVEDGQAVVEVPPGRFHFYAFRGPFWTIDRKTVTLTGADEAIPLSVKRLALQPPRTVTADMHVHSGISFDSSLPVRDRVVSFSAVDLQVIISTEHEVVADFSGLLRDLGLDDEMTAVSGTETTASNPFLSVPGDPYPRVIGHYIFWPLRYDPTAPRNGGPFDEYVEPGVLFGRVDPLYSGGVPIIQLNHPWGSPYFGRDSGWPRAVHLDLRQDLPSQDDGTNAGLYVRTPEGSKYRNDDHHAQEVMNGTQNDALLEYRAVWFYMLNQGRLKAGTANSDSHGLTDNTVGVPRNVVYADTTAGPAFDLDTFNRSVREGRILGTNGPVIEAWVKNGTAAPVPFGLAPVAPDDDAMLALKISAAPWVPIEEVRFVVNGKVKRLQGLTLQQPSEPFGDSGLVRLDAEIRLSDVLSDLVPSGQDAWLVIEAGAALPLAADLGGGLDGGPDGVPDTGDNNGDGKVDAADIEAGEDYGPLKRPASPKEETHPLFHFSKVVTDGYPFAFTNPFLLDRDRNGKFDAPGVGGAR